MPRIEGVARIEKDRSSACSNNDAIVTAIDRIQTQYLYIRPRHHVVCLTLSVSFSSVKYHLVPLERSEKVTGAF